MQQAHSAACRVNHAYATTCSGYIEELADMEGHTHLMDPQERLLDLLTSPLWSVIRKLMHGTCWKISLTPRCVKRAPERF